MTAHTGEAPAQAPRNKHEFTKGQRITAAVGGVAAFVAVGGFVGYKAIESGTEKGIENALGGEKSSSLSHPNAVASSPVPIEGDSNHDGVLSLDELDAMNPSEVKNAPLKDLLNAYGPYFDMVWDGTYQNLLSHNNLTPDQQAFMSVPTGPKENYDEATVLKQIALNKVVASVQPDSIEGMRMIPLVINKDAGGFSDEVKDINSNKDKDLKVPSIEVFKQIGSALPHPEESFYGVDLSAYSKVDLIEVESVPSPGKELLHEFHLEGLLKDGSNEEWQRIRRWDRNDPGVIAAVNDLIAKTSPSK